MFKRLAPLVLGFCICTTPALAKELKIHTWVHNEKACVEAFYTDGSKLFAGDILVENTQGQELARGITDETGQWCYTPEKSEDLRIFVKDQQGRTSEGSLELRMFKANLEQFITQNLSQAELRTMMREEVATQLRPIHHELRPNNTPGVVEIVGGIGWVIGICALGGAWSKKKE